jgi:hypothetical protein
MSIRYYPKSKIKTNLIASGKNLYLDGKPYVGKYYETYDGKLFSGANPIVGDNRLLSRASEYETTESNADHGNSNTNIINKTPDIFEKRIISSLNNANRIPSKPISYFPKPLPEDYSKGYITRYFIKGINQNGYITEISPTEYANFQDGTVNYDVSLYLVGSLNWKLIGPLNSIRLSQYDIRMGIIDMNKKQTEELNKTFLGITQYIAENYTQFAKPTR